MKYIGSLLLLMALCAPAMAQDTLAELVQPGTAGNTGMMRDGMEIVPLSAGITDNPQLGRILLEVEEDVPLTTRGPQEAALYRRAAPSVVLIVTKDGLGSGSLINNNLIITNEHVVSGYQSVAVVFKPRQEGREADETDAVQGKVILVDKERDLALVQVNIVPGHVKPLRLGSMNNLSVGSDVHAIGHPMGSSWTYTKGIISQIRDINMRNSPVKIIQTQTPINPGNSGGPLLNDKGEIVGVNTFKLKESEGLNFAVSVDEVRRFVDGKSPTASPPASAPQQGAAGRTMNKDDVYMSYEGRNKRDTASIMIFSVKGSEQIFAVMALPDDKRQPLMFFIDRNLDDNFDAAIYSTKRTGEWWNDSYWDDDFDGKYELRGQHQQGNIEPDKFVSHRSGKLPY